MMSATIDDSEDGQTLQYSNGYVPLSFWGNVVMRIQSTTTIH